MESRMRARRWYLVALGIVVVIIGYAIVSRLMIPVPPRFDQPWQSPSYTYRPVPNRKAVPGAETGFIHATKHGDTTSLAVWGNYYPASGGRRQVTPGYASGRVTDSRGDVIFQWEARL